MLNVVAYFKLRQQYLYRPASVQKMQRAYKRIVSRAVGRVRHYKLAQLGIYPLRRNILQPFAACVCGGKRVFIRFKAKLPRKAAQPQYSHPVVPHYQRGVGICGAEYPLLYILNAACGVCYLLCERVKVNGVHGKVPPERVLLKRCREADLAWPMAARAVVTLSTECGVFKAHPAHNYVQRAERRALFAALYAPRGKHGFNILYPERAANVCVVHGVTQQAVAHHAAHGVQPRPVFTEYLRQCGKLRSNGKIVHVTSHKK